MYYKTLLKQWFVSSSAVLRTREIKLLNLKTIPWHLLVLWAVRDYMKSILFPLVLLQPATESATSTAGNLP